MIGPGMAAVNRSPCIQCRGTGKQNSGTCGNCNGKRYFKKEKVLDVKIEAGMSFGDSLMFPKECSDDIQFEEAGDVKIVLIEADSDSSIRRINNDLHSTFKIPFKESLLGTIYETMEHPGHKEGFKILIPKGTMNNEVLSIDNEGMPKRNTKQFGNFYLKVIIDVSEKDKQVLKDNEEVIKNLFTFGD
jgi:DnaJ-class molecular chaperone